MHKNSLTKISGIINSVVFLALNLFFLLLTIISATFLFGVERFLWIFTPLELRLASLTFLTLLDKIAPSLNEYALVILCGAMFLLCFLNFFKGVRQIKISNLELTKYYKKRASLGFKNFCLLIFCATGYFFITSPTTIVKIISVVVYALIFSTIILVIIDKIRAKRAYKKLVKSLKDEEAKLSLQQRQTPVTPTAPTPAPVYTQDEILNNKKLIAEIAKLDKLQRDGVISTVRYTKMREDLIKQYGKTI